jgi:hypothetical protein
MYDQALTTFLNKNYRFFQNLPPPHSSCRPMASFADCGMPEPVSNLNETGVLVMGPGAKKGDPSFVGPSTKLSFDENIAVQVEMS